MLQVSLQDIPSMRDFLADVVDLRDVSQISCCFSHHRGGCLIPIAFLLSGSCCV
jgi:hypothetical protein